MVNHVKHQSCGSYTYSSQYKQLYLMLYLMLPQRLRYPLACMVTNYMQTSLTSLVQVIYNFISMVIINVQVKMIV